MFTLVVYKFATHFYIFYSASIVQNMRLVVLWRKLALLRAKQAFYAECFIQKCSCSSDSKSNRVKVSAVVTSRRVDVCRPIGLCIR